MVFELLLTHWNRSQKLHRRNVDNNIREELAGIKNELEGSKKILGKCASALVSLLCEKI